MKTMTDQEFAEYFDRYMFHKRESMRVEYNRVLPSGDLLFNRFDKAQYLRTGANSSVYDTSVVIGDIEIGEKVWIGPYTLLEGSNARLVIGNFVSIDSGVMIYTHDSTKHYLSGGVDDFEKGDVFIGDNTVIGTMSMIGCGVTIGSHCVIGAHSFVNSNIPDNSIAVGIPAKIIGRVYIKDNGSAELVYEI